MLEIDRQNNTLTPIAATMLSEAGYRERDDLQPLIRDNSKIFFDDLGEKLLLLGEEVHPADAVDNRIDLLAIDPEGAAVILELKRGSNRYQLLQALSYAAMIADWDADALIDLHAKLKTIDVDSARDTVEEFIAADLDAINRSQRVILIAEGFDYEVLVAADWLTERYGLDIRCYQLKLAQHNGSELLGCTRVFPPRDVQDQVTRRSRRRVGGEPRWSDWPAALASIRNDAVKQFFEEQLATGRENQLAKRILFYRVSGKRRWSVHARADRAYVWQHGRFEGDTDHWRQRLSALDDIRSAKGGQRLSFRLNTAEDFKAFLDAVDSADTTMRFLGRDEVLPDIDESDPE